MVPLAIVYLIEISLTIFNIFNMFRRTVYINILGIFKYFRYILKFIYKYLCKKCICVQSGVSFGGCLLGGRHR